MLQDACRQWVMACMRIMKDQGAVPEHQYTACAFLANVACEEMIRVSISCLQIVLLCCYKSAYFGKKMT